jgi:hypothetical protein
MLCAYSRESTVTVSLLLKRGAMHDSIAHYLFRIFILYESMSAFRNFDIFFIIFTREYYSEVSLFKRDALTI